MKATRTIGVGTGALIASALASCPIIQAAVLGMLGALGALPLIQGYRAVLGLGVVACGALAVYGVVRLARGRRLPLGIAGDTQR
jgi:hypothetical protein